MPASQVETLTNPRDSLPNVYTDVTAREQDFVTVFQQDWEALRAILGISRPIKKAPGTRLAAYEVSVALESGDVDPGCVIPFSKRTVIERVLNDVDIQKYGNAVTVEEVMEYGVDRAIEKGDEAFRLALEGEVLDDFYAFARTGTLTGTYTTFQKALAMARGAVLNKFKGMRKAVTDVVGFANILDAHEYLGDATISTQTTSGVQYLKDFLGYSTLFLLSDEDIPQGTVIATPTDNIDLYYIDPSDTAVARLGLQYTVAGETNLIGFHVQGNYSTATGETYAIVGMTLWAEYLDGIAVMTFASSGSLGSLTVSTAAGTVAVGDSVLTLPDHTVAGGKYYWKAQASTAPADATYGAKFNATGWTEVEDGDTVATTNGHKYRLVEVNAMGQAVASATGTVTAKAS